jgi:hypothetical protein
VRFASDTIPFSLSPTLPPGLDLAATQVAIADAAATWSGPQCSGLQFFLGSRRWREYHRVGQ